MHFMHGHNVHISSFQLSYAHAYSGEWTKWGNVSILHGYPHGYPPTSGVKEAACHQWGKHVHDRVFHCSFMWVTPSAIYCRQELTGVCHTDTQHVIWYREHTNIRTGEHCRDNVVWMLALFPGPYRNSGRGPVDVPPCDEPAYLHSVHGCHTPSFHPPCTLAYIYTQESGPSEDSALETLILSTDIPSPAVSQKRPATSSQLQPHPGRYHGPLSDVSMCMRGFASGPLFICNVGASIRTLSHVSYLAAMWQHIVHCSRSLLSTYFSTGRH